MKHLVRWGCGDASILEKRWNIELPDWFRHFYSKVETAVLAWRNLFCVLHPQNIILVEEEHREWHDNKDLAVRLVRFAQVWGSGDYLALRQSTKDQKWRIMYVSHEESTAYFQAPQMDGSEDDEDLAAWMSRMIMTDGHPMLKGNQEFEDPFLNRIG